jgi:class 3 adenylate cyclase
MKPVTATLPNGSLFEDRYEVLGELGSGSYGRVYQAKQLSTGKAVALKLLSPREGMASSSGREAERFHRETQIGATLSHTNIVELIDKGETQDGQLYAVFVYIAGETLEQTLANEGPLEVRESLRLMTQTLDALACAHARGIVHRDLKPSNIMLSGTGVRRNALVLDFGLGGVIEGRRRKEWQTLTQSREFLGTPLYAAPEQLAGESPTERSDLYAWGLIFLECLTGRHPFEAEGAAARFLTGGGAVEIPEWLRGHRLGALLEAVMARDPDKRDVSVEALIEALDAIAGGGELPVAPEVSPAPAPLTDHGERRHLTVMFCDLVGSTALSQQLDAEAYRRVVQAYQARAAEAIERYGGHVAQYLGDGLLIYFGYPQAHEDDADRAVRAGREVLRELETLNPRLEAEHGVQLSARVGIHTGPVVVDEMGGGEKKETLALGDTPNVAARLEGIAEPGTVVISDATLHLVAGLFVTEDRGTPALKGIAEPIRVHRVLQPSGVTSRLDRAPTLTPFVGREQELGLLLDRFEQAQEQHGQAVLIAGEAGIGKSRLVHQLRERLRETPHSWLECRTSPYTQNSALYPLIELVEQAHDFGDEHSPEEKLGRLERGLAHVGLEPAEAVPLLASLLSLRLPERYAPLEISPQLQRQKTLETLLAWVLALGEKQPVVLLVEDLHWIDPSTLEWLGLLIEQCPTVGVLLLLTHRPDFEPPWPSRTHLLPMGLIRLSRRQAKQLVAGAISESTLPEALLDAIAERADCVPLFAEELAKEVVESGR